MAVERAKEALAMMRVCVETSHTATSAEQTFDHLQMAFFWTQIYFVEQAASEMGRKWRADHPDPPPDPSDLYGDPNDGHSADNAVS